MKYGILLLILLFFICRCKTLVTRPAQYGCKNIFGLYHTIGNVSEIVYQSGIVKGGDWKHKLEGFDPLQNTKQNIPNCWTGFRCVGKLEVLNLVN